MQEAAVETGLLASILAVAEQGGDVLASRGPLAPARTQQDRKSAGAAPRTRTALSNLSNLCRARAAHKAEHSNADLDVGRVHEARHQLHLALLCLQHLMLDSAVAQVCTLQREMQPHVCHCWEGSMTNFLIMSAPAFD